MRILLYLATLLLIPACMTTAEGKTPTVSLETANSEAVRAFKRIKAEHGDTKAGIWKDPIGCFHYTAERGAEAWMQPLKTEKGQHICE